MSTVSRVNTVIDYNLKPQKTIVLEDSFFKRNFLSSLILVVVLALLCILSGCSKKKKVRVLPEISSPSLTYQEGSLWPREAKGLFLFKDTKAKKVGDIITVHIVESTKAVNKAATKQSRKSNNKLSMKLDKQNIGYNMGGGTDFDGGGQTSRSGSLKTTLTAIVTEVLPNGNLKIDGVKEIAVNGDEQYITVTGIVRPEDISRNNSVFSNSIAEVKIMYKGEGALADTQGRGWAGKLLAWVWPF